MVGLRLRRIAPPLSPLGKYFKAPLRIQSANQSIPCAIMLKAMWERLFLFLCALMCPNSQELVEDIILESSHQVQSSRLVNLPGPNLISPNPRLLDILSGGSWDASRVEAAQRVEDLVEALIEAYQQMEMKNDEAQRLLEGKWFLGTMLSII